MAIKFQYNKTSLQSLNKQLNMRVRALPTIKNKEAALRIEVKRAKNKANELEKELIAEFKSHALSAGMWNEFIPGLISLSDIQTGTKKIAGVKIPVLEQVVFKEKEFWMSQRTEISEFCKNNYSVEVMASPFLNLTK